MDELSSNVSTLNLERVRQIKSRLVAISGRVQKVIKLLDHSVSLLVRAACKKSNVKVSHPDDLQMSFKDMCDRNS